MKQSINSILKNVAVKISPSQGELKSIEKIVKEFIEDLNLKLKEGKINAEVFVGGSFAKKTMIKKGLYDIDIFVRFNEEYRGKNISELLEKIIKKIKYGKKTTIHGSRDYFKVESEGENFFLEIIPVLKVRNPKEAENITDLSYFHVNYVKKKMKEKMLDDIRLAKAFCHANKCYGAESYISGFSGYALELLIIHYKSFLNFVKAMIKTDREIIDIEKLYKSRLEINMDMNSAKMISPIVLIDPTYKGRNALAALSKETFGEFKEACRKFLKNPSEDAFEVKKYDLEKIKKKAEKNRNEFLLLEAKTEKQEGDVAGSKLAKFYRHFSGELTKFYEIKERGFEYSGKKEAEYFFVIKNKGEVTFSGPEIKDRKENIKKFRARHKNVFEKKGRLYARERNDTKIKDWTKNWMNANAQKMIEMGINEIRIES